MVNKIDSHQWIEQKELNLQGRMEHAAHGLNRFKANTAVVEAMDVAASGGTNPLRDLLNEMRSKGFKDYSNDQAVTAQPIGTDNNSPKIIR